MAKILPVRLKRVAAAFDEFALVRDPCDGSSGSEHDPNDLSNLVESFIEREGKFEETVEGGELRENDLVSLGRIITSNWDEDGEEARDKLQVLLGLDVLLSENEQIIDEIESACGSIESNSSSRGYNLYKRQLMSRLRDRGFDAGLCKVRWEKSGHTPAGNYEYLDINIKGNRYIVEVFLAGEFQIARPTKRYRSLLEVFPKVFIGKPGNLKKIVNTMCDAIKQSMKSMGMTSVPPWRRKGYMQAKWFSASYKRTINENPTPKQATTYNHNTGGGGGGGDGALSAGFVGAEFRGGLGAFPRGKLLFCCRDDFTSKNDLKIGYLSAAFKNV